METQETVATESKLTKDQKIKTGWRMIGKDLRIRAKLRYDDECNNGHNTFSITGETQRLERGKWREDSGGCIHEEIAEHFPEYAHLIKWHLVSSDGPMHYLANTLWFVSDRDSWGKRAGEPASFSRAVKFGSFPINVRGLSDDFLNYLSKLGQADMKDLVIEEIPHQREPQTFGPNYTFQGFSVEWYKCPFDSKIDAEEFLQALQQYPFEIIKTPTSFSKGKERELDHARSAAVWPDATDQDLLDPNLKDVLIARLPKLLAEFRAAMESVGFTY